MKERIRARCPACGSLVFIEKLDEDHEFAVFVQRSGGRGKISYQEIYDPVLKGKIWEKFFKKIKKIV